MMSLIKPLLYSSSVRLLSALLLKLDPSPSGGAETRLLLFVVFLGHGELLALSDWNEIVKLVL